MGWREQWKLCDAHAPGGTHLSLHHSGLPALGLLVECKGERQWQNRREGGKEVIVFTTSPSSAAAASIRQHFLMATPELSSSNARTPGVTDVDPSPS